MERQLNQNPYVIAATLKIQKHLLTLSEAASALEHLITEALTRSNKSIALSNLCNYISGELRQTSIFYPSNVAGLAWSTRNLFETNLIIRHILTSESNFSKWMGQALHDEKDFIDSILAMPQDAKSSASVTQLRLRLAELQEMAQRHGLMPSKPFRVPEIAKSLGLQDEYNSLYKLFSKYVHPSSLLVNSWHRHAPNRDWVNIFLTRSQLYSGDSIHRIRESCGF